MIKLTGSIQRAFIFPAAPDITLSYYSELIRVAQFMPYISLVHTYSPHQIRALYQSIELGSYTIKIYTDLEGKIDITKQTISVYPIKIENNNPIEEKATLRETVGHGLFAINAQLFDLGSQTRIEATLRLEASLERPRGMNLMPKRVVNRLANGITSNRIKEMADGFIKNSIDFFEEWQLSNTSPIKQ